MRPAFFIRMLIPIVLAVAAPAAHATWAAGSWSVTLTAGNTPGVDRLDVTADDGIRPVILMPAPILPVGVPGEVQNLRWSDADTLGWDAVADAVSYHVYRGELAALSCGSLGECRDDLDTDVSDLVLNDSSQPAAGAGFLYLITAVDASGLESIFGSSDCGLRTNAVACP